MAAISSFSSQMRTLTDIQLNHQQRNSITDDLSQRINEFCGEILRYNGISLSTEISKITNEFSKFRIKIRQFDEDETFKRCEAILKSAQEEVDRRVSVFYCEFPKLHPKYSSSSSSSSISGSASFSSSSSSSS